MAASKRKAKAKVEPAGVPLVTRVAIENFRSIVEADVEIGRLTVIVGANGAGKTNFLEGIAVAGAAAEEKVGHEYLAARGIRSLDRALAASKFDLQATGDIVFTVRTAGGDWLKSGLSRTHDHTLGVSQNVKPEALERWNRALASLPAQGSERLQSFKVAFDDLAAANRLNRPPGLASFLIFAPEYAALRTFADEGQILPLGVRGEGLFKHLVDLSKRHPAIVTQIGEHLKVLDWFDGFVIPNDLGPGEKRLGLRDRYLAQDVLLDQRASNEGFLFLLFAYTLMLSPDTPRFFAIDNAEAALNPRLCARLAADIAKLAREQDKQVIITTHNPAMLDGIDLADDEQRLLVCSRDLDGHTRFRRVEKPAKPGVNLSEAFLRGYLGGLPTSF